MTCDRSWEIDALREGKLGVKDAEAFERHLRACPDCAAEKANADRLRMLGSESPPASPSALELRRIRQRMLRSQALGERPSGPARARFVAIVALVAVAATVVVLVMRQPRPAAIAIAAAVAPSASAAAVTPALAGTVEPAEGAVWSQTRVDRIEHVTLDEGHLHIHVRHQERGERFFVDLPDGDLEVRGTTFDVDAHAGATRLVSVEEGVVAWRRAGSDEILLHAGDAWTATQPSSSRAAPAPSSPPPPSSSSPASRPQASEPDDGTRAYGAALDLFRRAHYLEASLAFERLLASHPHAAQAEDASYLDALSLARAGRTDAAGAAASHHLRAFPASFHRKDASILVARAARDRGDCEDVRRILAPWLGSPPDSEASATSASCIPKP